MNHANRTLLALSIVSMLCPMGIGAAIDHFRRRAGLTQSELALRAELSQSDISRIIRGKQDLTVSRLEQIAKALGVVLIPF